MIPVDVFQSLFLPGRTDCYAKMKGTRAICIKEPLTPEVLQQHLKGEERIAVYPLTLEGRIWLGYIDLDKGAAPVLELVTLAKKWGFLLAVEKSKSKGYHLWLFFSESVLASKVRALFLALLKHSGWIEHKVEIFPKQDHPGEDGYGNPMYLPFHGGSVKEGRCLFLNLSKEHWPPYQDQVKYLQIRPQLSEADLDKIVRRQKIVAFPPGGSDPSPPKTPTASESRQGRFDFPPCFAKIYAEGTSEPGRANWLHGLARQFNKRGLPEEATLGLLTVWNEKNRPGPLPDQEIRDGIRSAYAKGYTSLGCENLDGARGICGDQCPALKKDRPSVATATDTTDERSAIMVPMNMVVAEDVDWLWPGRIPRGMAAMIVGDPGTGKSYLLIDILSRITTGSSWPGGEKAPQGNVMFLTAEDTLPHTVRPRIDAQGGDPSRFFVLQAVFRRRDGIPEHFSLREDLDLLEREIKDKGVIAVGIDPMSAYLGTISGDSYKDAAVRDLMAPLTAVIERTGISFIGVMHLSKKEQKQAIYRPGASIAFVAAPRAVFAVMRDVDDRDRRLFFPLKMNIAPEPAGLAFRIPYTFQGVSRVEWEPGEITITPEQLLVTSERDRPEREMAAEFLTEVLRYGPVLAEATMKEAEKLGHSPRTIHRAKAELGVESRKYGFNPAVWYWIPRGYPWETFDPATFDPTEGGRYPKGKPWEYPKTGPVLETSLVKRPAAVEEPPEVHS